MKKFWTIHDLEQLRADKNRAAEMSKAILIQSMNGKSVDRTALDSLLESIHNRRANFLKAIEKA